MPVNMPVTMPMLMPTMPTMLILMRSIMLIMRYNYAYYDTDMPIIHTIIIVGVIRRIIGILSSY